MNSQLFLAALAIFAVYVATQTYDPCTDKYSQCKMWKMQNMCQMTGYKEYMMTTCPESCEMCTGYPAQPPVVVNYTDKNHTAGQKPQEIPPSEVLPNATEKETPKNTTEYAFTLRQTASDVTPIPHAMKLIQSLSQMISQTARKGQSQMNFERNKIRVNEKAKKKHWLLSAPKDDMSALRLAKRAKFITEDGSDDKIPSEKTLNMLVTNKKRSRVAATSSLKDSSHSLSHKKHSRSTKKLLTAQKSRPLPHSDIAPGPEPSAKPASKPQSKPKPASPPPTAPKQPPQQASKPLKTTTVQQTTEQETTTTVTAQPATSAPAPQRQGLTTEATTESEEESSTTVASSVSTTESQEPSDTAVSESCDSSSEDCSSRYTLIIKQPYDPDYSDKTSSKYSMLKGNVIQDITYTLGSDAVVGQIGFDKTKCKTTTSCLTKVYFNISGDLSGIHKLEELVNKGNVNGLKVQPYSLQKQ